MTNNLDLRSKPVTSNQDGPHQDLEKTIAKHLAHRFAKPIAEHTKAKFAELQQQLTLSDKKIILDSGCGNADSCIYFAQQHQNHFIIGVDKSQHRLRKAQLTTTPNLYLLRAELIDFWRLAKDANWVIDKPLYPLPKPVAEIKTLEAALACPSGISNNVNFE